MAQQEMSPQMQNMYARQNLLATGISMVKQLAPVTLTENSTTKIPLLRMGIMTGVLLQFTMSMTLASAAETGTAVVSPIAPWNSVRRVTYNDFAGVKRTNTNGFQLWLAQNFKMGDAQGAISPQPIGLYSDPSSLDLALNNSNLFTYNNNVLAMRTPNWNGSGEITPSAAGDDLTVTFSLYVPMAYDPSTDLTGAVLTQTNVGEHYIDVDMNNLVGTDLWQNLLRITGDTVVSDKTITVQAFQQYIQPQAMTAEHLPIIDLSTIYGFEGGYETTANIQAGMDTFINYPNNRSVLSALVNFQNGNAFDDTGSDVNQVVLIANSNTNFKEMTPRFVKEMMRNLGNFDAPGGAYYIPSRRQPILTQLYANVQLRMNVASVGVGNTKFISQYEVQYASGAPLPGVTIAA